MIGIVADDITGANDIGLMYAKNRWLARIVSPYSLFRAETDAESDALILETNSRLDDPAAACAKVHEATRVLLSLGTPMLIKKTCSVFRGNVGAEFDAMLDAAGGDFAVVTAAFPDNGRTTVHGIHYVNGIPLSGTAFRNDPAHPMKEDSLLKILSSQTEREVHHLDITVIAEGEYEVKKAAEKARKRGGYLLCDAASNKDLNLLASVFRNERFMFGSSAISAEIPLFQPPLSRGLAGIRIPAPAGGTLVLAGSVTPQTREQVRYWIDSGLPEVPVSGEKIFREGDGYLSSIVRDALILMEKRETALVHVLNDSAAMQRSYSAAAEAGLGPHEAGIAVSRFIGRTASAIYEKTGFNRLVVAGGETSNHVALALGIRGNLVIKEIEPGLPMGLSLGDNPAVVVFKSGSFGRPEFLIRAIGLINRKGLKV